MVQILLSLALFAQDAPYSSAELSLVEQKVDDFVRRGRFLHAAEQLRNLSKARIPAADAARFLDKERRVATLASLLVETGAGDTLETPKLTRIAIKNGGKPLGRIFKDDGVFVHYETITGIRSRLAKELIDTLVGLTAAESATEVQAEFKRQCGNKALMLQLEPGKPPAWKELGGKKATGAQYFALAEFAARNGAGEYLAGLFDLALARDPQIRATAHAAKGERLVHQLLFSLTVNQMPQAGLALDQLTARYRDTTPYREKVYGDADLGEIVKVLLKRELAKPELPPPPPKPVEDPTAKVPDAPAAPDPLPVPVIPVPDLPGPGPVSDPVSAGPLPVTTFKLPTGTAPEVVELVARGDRDFDEAMKHLLNSDPSLNPDGWGQENAKALGLFRKANTEAYLPAQEKYSSAVPQPLLDRVRETTMRTSLCRKRSVKQG